MKALFILLVFLSYSFASELTLGVVPQQSALKLSYSIEDPVVTVPTLIGIGNIHKRRKTYDSAEYYSNKAFNIVIHNCP